MKQIELSFVSELKKHLSQRAPLIQVVLGPRQVGKTTGVKQLLEAYEDSEYLYFSADGDIPRSPSWITEKWYIAKSNLGTKLLVIDEIQKIENWAAKVKQLWDEQHSEKKKLKLVLLGSSSLSIQSGLSESLAGRFYIHRVHHWILSESREAYGLDLEKYLLFGGYPGSYRFIEEKSDWLNYLRHSIIDAVIGKDILTQATIKAPSLFKQCFDLAISYPAQEISYTKLLGQLQDKGNTNLVKRYLEYLESAFLVKQLFKYSEKKIVSKSSSPKLLPLCPALFSSTLDAELNEVERGRNFEVSVGCELNRLPGDLFYWREKNYEMDFVYRYGKTLLGIEVKSGRKKSAKGIDKFKERFPQAKILIVTPENFFEFTKTIQKL